MDIDDLLTLLSAFVSISEIFAFRLVLLKRLDYGLFI